MRRNFLSDLLLNSFSSAAGLILIQMIIYPYLGRELSEQQFGDLVFIMAVVNVAGMFIGNSLGLLALRQRTELEREDRLLDRLGELNFLFWWTVTLFSALTIFFVSFYNDYPYVIGLIAASLVLTISARSYAQAGFRIFLDYKKIFISNILHALVHFLGLVIWVVTHSTTPLYIFLFGELVTAWYVIAKSPVLRLTPHRTSNSIRLMREYVLFIFSSFTQQIVTYGDRFIIKFTIGIESIPVFFAASVNGKILALLASYFSTVSLSHLVHEPMANIRRKYIGVFSLSVLVFCGFFALVEMFTPHIIQLFYPKYYEQVLDIHLVVNIAFTLFAFEKIYQSVLIRLVSADAIFYFNGLSAVLYFAGGIYAAVEYGLYGFAVSFAVISVLKVVIQQAIILNAIYRKPVEGDGVSM